jgi:Zn-dependent M28 family amino/carboxypeptidase
MLGGLGVRLCAQIYSKPRANPSGLMKPLSNKARWAARLAALLALLAGSWGSLAWMTVMPGRSWDQPVPALDPSQRDLSTRLQAHVHALAVEIGPRDAPEGLARAARYLETQWRAQGWEVRAHPVELGDARGHNLEIELLGSSQPSQVVLVGAHYDTHPGSPGADDNASGVAALIELGRLLRHQRPARTVRLVAFVYEEQPFAHTDAMGSRVYAKRARAKGEDIVLMLALDGLGRFDARPGTQRQASWVLEPAYPSRADFLAICGDTASRPAVREVTRAFRQHARVPTEGLAAPPWLAGTHRSDHRSFWLEGYPAVMLTDTAELRSEVYHTPQDLPETVDFTYLTHITEALAATLLDLADAPPEGLGRAGR